MFTTNAALNYHCKSKHNEINGDSEDQATKMDENVILSMHEISKLETLRVKRPMKRKIPKIVYVMPGKVESELDDPSKVSRIEKRSKIEIQSISSIPMYILDHWQEIEYIVESIGFKFRPTISFVDPFSLHIGY